MSKPLSTTGNTSTNEIKENIRKAYNDIADTYLEWTEPTHKVRLSHLETLLKALDSDSDSRPANTSSTTSKSILELGCGAGIPTTKTLSDRSDLNITANDISESQIALAKARLPSTVSLIQGDMMGLTFPESHFDAVLAMYSIIHLPRDEQSEMLRRIWKWLKPGGRFLGNFSETGFSDSVDEKWLGGRQGEMYWSGWGRDEIRRILEEVGFFVEVDEVVVDVEVVDGVGRDVPFHWVLVRKPEGV